MNSVSDTGLTAAADRDRLSLALEAAGVVGIWDGDLVNDRVYADESFARIYGVDALDAARGKPLGYYFQFIHGDDLASSTAAIERMKAGLDEYANEHRIVRPDGSLRWVLARGRLARDRSGRPVRFHGVSIDLTERKLAENRQAFLLQLNDELRTFGDPGQVLATAMARLGTHLGASRAGYGQIQPDRATVLVTCDYASSGAEAISGSFRLEDFGTRLAACARLGLTLVEDDVLSEPHMQSPAWSAFGTRAHVSVPLIRDGQYRALLYVTHTRPHRWTGDEVQLIEEVAARVWDALERARAERALHRANKELETLVAARTADRNRIWQLAEELMIICDTAGRLIEVNPAASRLAGLPERELRGMPLTGLLHPDDVERTTAEMRNLVAGRSSAAFENRFRTRSGAYRVISWMAIADGGFLHGVGRDITEVQAARRERDRSWALSPIIKAVATVQGTLLSVNPAWINALGWSETESVGRDVMSFVAPQDRRAGTTGMEQLAGGMALTEFRLNFLTKSGAVRCLSWTTVPDGDQLYGFARDVTVEVTAAEALEASRAERERLWTATNDLMGTASFDGYLVSVNPAWTRMLGFSESELTSRHYMEFVDPEDHERSIAIVGRMQRGEGMHNFESRMLHKDGRRFVILWTGQRHGDLMYLVGRDITAQRAAEENLRQSQKMQAVGQLTGGIAHDFNNMLQGIGGAVEIMSRRIAQGRLDEAQHYIAVARQSIDRAATLTHRLLAFSRRQALAPQAVQPNELLNGIGKLIQQTVGPMIDLRLRLEDGCWPVRCDPSQLDNAVLNLAINARDAMLPDGGSLVIETGHTVAVPADVAGWEGATPGDFVCLSVRDTGVGMPPDVVQRAFEPFFTTKPEGQGTGLGLSQVYGFVSQSGGFMKLGSEVGVGTVVQIYLPRYVGEPVMNAADADSALLSRFAARTATVLLVEDEAHVRNLTAEMLRERRHIVIEAHDGSSALAALLERLTMGSSIDILVADIGLPGGINGRQLANAARQHLPDLPVLLITGYAGQALGPGPELAGDIALLSKPFSFEALCARVESLIAAQEPCSSSPTLRSAARS
jgi:PAS domain S-box-containing protein